MITEDMSQDGLFEVLGNMLGELKDGHVNLYSASDMSRYWSWHEDYPRIFVILTIENRYLGNSYRIAGGMKYTILSDNIGYVYYEDFSRAVGEGNLDEMLAYFAPCNGIIFDVRDNGGGTLTYAELIAARFTNEKVHTGYIMHKTGPGHNQFSQPKPVYVEPSNPIRLQKPVAVLTNRRAYTTTNQFANIMRYMPNAVLIGDRTGGGAGLPFTSELPNGWGVRFSASPHLDAEKNHIEFGIEPDIKIDLTSLTLHDDIIEEARKTLKNMQ